MFVAIINAVFGSAVKWLLEILFKKADPEEQKIKQQEELLEYLEHEKEFIHGLSDSPDQRRELLDTVNDADK